MSSSPEPNPPSLRELALGSIRLGLVVGGGLLGQTLAWLHLRYNEIASVGVAAAAWLWFTLIFAGLCVSFVLFGAMIAWLVSRRRNDRASRLSLAWCFGLWSFLVVYLGFGLLYGLTYEQTVFWSPQTWVGMTAYLVVCSVVLALILALLVRTLGPLVVRTARITPQRLVAGFGIALVVLVLTAILTSPPAPPALRRAAAAGVEVVPLPESPVAAADERSSETTAAESSVPVSFPARHVVLIGLDGLDPDLLLQLVAEGRLPNFQRRIESGVFAPLATLPDANSAVIWATIYSGWSPKAHGIHDFYRIQLPGLGSGFFPVHRVWFKELAGILESVGLARRIPIQRGDLRRFPIWEIADRFGVSTGVIDGYLYSNPAIPFDSEGSFFVAYGTDWFTAELEAGRATGEGLLEYMRPVDLLPRERLPKEPDFAWQSRVALELMREGRQPRFLNLYAHEPDALQHESWRGIEPEKFPFPPEDGDLGVIERKHEEFDHFLGELERAAAPDTVFLLVSDHGHVATMVHELDSQHRHGPPGVAMIWGAGVETGASLDAPHVLDVAPTVLALLGMPVPRDFEGRAWIEAFSSGLAELAAPSIPTYEGLWAPPVGSERDDAARRRELQKLDAMGYL